MCISIITRIKLLKDYDADKYSQCEVCGVASWRGSSTWNDEKSFR